MATAGPDPETLALLQRIYPVSRETIRALEAYRHLLERWQKRTNLVAPSTLQEFWTRHVADSLQILEIAPGVREWTDLGSGGGFPGMVVAIVLGQQHGTGMVRLVESNAKKCSFLRQVARITGARAEIHQIRIESATKQLRAAEAITARALAPLENLLGLVEGHLTGERFGLFHKGRENQQEIQQCRGGWSFDLVVHPSRIGEESVILEVRNAVRNKNPSRS